LLEVLVSFSKMKILVSKQDQAVIGDPSEFRPDLDYDPRKSTEDFRNFVVRFPGPVDTLFST
jgi:hypothetical protein